MVLVGTGVFAEILDSEVYRYYADGEWGSSASGKSSPYRQPHVPTTRKATTHAGLARPRWPLCRAGKAAALGLWGSCWGFSSLLVLLAQL
jgi:hypothetical protein